MWDDSDLDPRQTQPPSYEDTMKAETEAKPVPKPEAKPKGRSCPACCLRTRDCLMSGECGRALQICSVVAMCGMCIQMWMCNYPFSPATLGEAGRLEGQEEDQENSLDVDISQMGAPAKPGMRNGAVALMNEALAVTNQDIFSYHCTVHQHAL
ncbi:unnamed protein product [Lota lota]